MDENYEVRLIREDEIEETRKLSSICFDYPYKEEPDKSKAYRHWDKQYAMFNRGDEMMACMAAVPFSFYFEGEAHTGYGIGNVCTYPHHRKKGAVRRMFEAMLADAYSEGCLISYLYPFSEAFYAKFGYRRMSHSIRYKLDLKGIPEQPVKGNFELYTPGREDVMKACQEAYEEFARGLNLMIRRDEDDWGILKDAEAYRNNNYLYLYRDSDQRPAGYIVFKRRGDEIACRELVFRDYAALREIFSFMKGYASDYSRICFHAPEAFSLETLCTDFCAYPSVMEKAMNGMVRILNVEKALWKMHYRGSGRIRIMTADHQIPENNGLFEVQFVEGSASSVSFLPMEEAQAAAYDAAMDIGTFSAAACGNYHTEELRFLPQTEICDIEICRKAFYHKPSFINNYF